MLAINVSIPNLTVERADRMNAVIRTAALVATVVPARAAEHIKVDHPTPVSALPPPPPRTCNLSVDRKLLRRFVVEAAPASLGARKERVLLSLTTVKTRTNNWGWEISLSRNWKRGLSSFLRRNLQWQHCRQPTVGPTSILTGNYEPHGSGVGVISPVTVEVKRHWSNRLLPYIHLYSPLW